MWGAQSWLEKGKAIAANLDKQLNESVGIEADPSSQIATTSTTTADDNFLDDAWNDDDIDNLDTAIGGTADVNPPAIIPPSSAVMSSPLITTKTNHLATPTTAASTVAATTPTTLTTPKKVDGVQNSLQVPQALEKHQQQVPSLQQEPIVVAGTQQTDEVQDGWQDEIEGFTENDGVDDVSGVNASTAPVKKPPLPVEELQATITPATTEASATITTETKEASSAVPAATPVSAPVKAEEPTSNAMPADDGNQTQKEADGWVGEDDIDFGEEADETKGEANNLAANEVQEKSIDGGKIQESQAETPNDVSTKGATEAKETSAESLRIIDELKQQLAQREEQLANKSMQMTQMQSMFENEKQELIQKIKDTKDEAKRRIAKARERVESVEKNANQSGAMNQEQLSKQNEIIEALREEGEKLAVKQSEMEKTTRAARGEIRELKENLAGEIDEKEKALKRISELEEELKNTKNDLTSARKGETLSQKLDNELQESKETIANKEATILSLEQQVKEFKATIKELQSDLQQGRRSAALENERELQKSRKEHNDVIADLETKLRTNEREAGLREDALRNEVTELRKRWQDAIRRADGLSMDVQSSTGPLLRQLESMEKQNRARASAWAELETKLRNDIEENVIQNEKTVKERNEFKSKCNRYERVLKENDSELKNNSKTIDEQAIKLQKYEKQVAEMEKETNRLQEEYNKVEQIANEGVTKVRSEMSMSLIESEERYRNQIETLETELRIEKDKRTQLEQQVQELLDSVAGNMMTEISSNSSPSKFQQKMIDSKPRKLKEQSEGQAEILAGALNGLGGDDDDDAVDADNDDEDPAAVELSRGTSGGAGFAAMEQLTQSLKAAKSELEALRKSLKESEKTRENLIQELSESRQAKEKLPLFEEKVKELAADNRIKELEIQALQDDVAEVRELYRNQLNVLIEEKAAAASAAPPAAPPAAAPPADDGDTSPPTNNEEDTSPATENHEDGSNPVES